MICKLSTDYFFQITRVTFQYIYEPLRASTWTVDFIPILMYPETHVYYIKCILYLLNLIITAPQITQFKLILYLLFYQFFYHSICKDIIMYLFDN